MTGEELLTGQIETGDESLIHIQMFGNNDSFIGNAMDFYKDLFSGILPLLKQIAFWLVVLLVVFFLLLFLFNYMSARGRKKIQKEVKDDLHRRNREEYEKFKKNKESNNPPMGGEGNIEGHKPLDPEEKENE